MNGRHSASSASSSSTGGPPGPSPHTRPGPLHPASQHSSTSPHAAQAMHHQLANPCEWQLFTVLHRANLLQYYGTFISQGGDDVHQLLEAGEEEFLEIMALVGMASKPLHVRRLQKALQEYSINPATFQLLAMQKSGALPPSGPLLPGQPVLPYPSATALLNASPLNPLLAISSVMVPGCHAAPTVAHRPTSAQSLSQSLLPSNNSAIGGLPPPGINPGLPTTAAAAISVTSSESPSATSVQSNGSPNIWPSPTGDAFDLGISDPYGGNITTPTLTEDQIQRLSECAGIILRQVPDIEPKPFPNKKRISRQLLGVMEMPMDSPYRAEEFRRFAAIYGRFDAKRKADKPLTLHEVLVNEAAAQICLHRPALLIRRDELFPLARMVVKEAGFNYMKSSGRPKEYDEALLEGVPLIAHKRHAPSESASGNGDDGDGSGSPAPSTSSASQASPGTGALTISLSPPTSVLTGRGDERFGSLSLSSAVQANASKRQKRRLDEIGMELQRVSAEQQKHINEQDVGDGDVVSIQRELKRLAQRQLEQPVDESSLKREAESLNGQLSMQARAVHGGNFGSYAHPLCDLSRTINEMACMERAIDRIETRPYAN